MGRIEALAVNDRSSSAAPRRLSSTLEQPWALSAWCVVAAFGAYFCMYGFRKPFTAASYEDTVLWGIGYKTVLVTAQVFGYTLSKFVGIKVVAEVRPERRAIGIVVLIAVAQLALLGFGLVPPPYNFGFLFLNGLPLGMVFGLVLGTLEGRRMTEALTAGLCASFILADGVTKSVGAYLLEMGVSEYWMPFAAGWIFSIPLLGFVAMLTRIPRPTEADEAHRGRREPMDSSRRWRFFRSYALGLSLLIFVYLLITILRSVRADFAPQIWQGLGYTGQPSIFTTSEILVMLGVVGVNGMAVRFRDNRRAFAASLGTSVAGLSLVGVAVLGWRGGWDGFTFMVLVGLGLYIPYVAFHTTVFERLIAMTRDRGNIGYLMYLADSFGYLGYVAVMIARGIAAPEGDFLNFFLTLSVVIAVGSSLLLGGSWWYFARLRSPAAMVAAAT
jgi:hypothetical protein